MCLLPRPPTYPKFLSKISLHTSAGTKRKHTPPSTMTTMTPPSTMTNIQGEGLPSPSHNVLTNPPEPYKVKAHNGIVESAKKMVHSV